MSKPEDSLPSDPPQVSSEETRTPSFYRRTVLNPGRKIHSATNEICLGTCSVAWRARIRILVVFSLAALVLVPLIHFSDDALMRWIETWRTKEVARLGKLLSTLGQLQFVPLAIAVSLWIWTELTHRLSGRIAIWASILAMLVSGIAVQLPKFIFGRPRPHLKVPDQFAWFHPDWNSFPSGHATHWFALVGAIWVFSPRIALWLTPVAGVAAIARALVPRHYPSDLLAGAVFGLVFGLCFGYAAKAINERLGRLPETSTTKPPGSENIEEG